MKFKRAIVWLLVKTGVGEWVRKALAGHEATEKQTAVCQNEMLRRIKVIEADVSSLKRMEISRRKESGERLVEVIG